MPVTSYSTTPGSNNAAPPNGFPEGQAASSLNDCMRQIMADICYEAQINDVKSLNSISGVDTILADMDPELAAYVTGMFVIFVPAGTNTTAATLNIDGLGAKSIVKGNAVALVAGDLLAAVPALCIYNGTNFVLLNPQSIPITAAGLLAALLTVDGAGSGLDADLLDGFSSASFQLASGYTAADVLAKLLTVDGSGSGIDADLLDGQSSAAFAAASHGHAAGDITSGTIANARLPNVGAMPGITIASDPGGTPSGAVGAMFFYY